MMTAEAGLPGWVQGRIKAGLLGRGVMGHWWAVEDENEELEARGCVCVCVCMCLGVTASLVMPSFMRDALFTIDIYSTPRGSFPIFFPISRLGFVPFFPCTFT